MPNPRDLRNQPPVIPVAADPALTEHLLNAFNNEAPEKVELRQLFGPQMRQMGTTLDTYQVKPNMGKVNQEDMVRLGNKFLGLAQKHCDTLGKKQRYAVVIVDTRRSEKALSTYPFYRLPEVEGVPGDGSEGESESEKDPVSSDKLHRYTEMILLDGRYYREALTKDREHIFKMMDLQMQIISKQAEQLEKMSDKVTRAAEVSEIANSKIFEREQLQRKQEFTHKLLGEAADLVKGGLPILLQKMTGKEVIPITQSPESMSLSAFLGSLDEHQIQTAFTECDSAGNVVRAGIFSAEQSTIISAVSRNSMDPKALNELLPGGQYPVSTEQVIAAQALFGMKAVPLMGLMQAKQDEAAKAAATVVETAAPKSDRA